jgi:hypothetical protein
MVLSSHLRPVPHIVSSFQIFRLLNFPMRTIRLTHYNLVQVRTLAVSGVDRDYKPPHYTVVSVFLLLSRNSRWCLHDFVLKHFQHLYFPKTRQLYQVLYPRETRKINVKCAYEMLFPLWLVTMSQFRSYPLTKANKWAILKGMFQKITSTLNIRTFLNKRRHINCPKHHYYRDASRDSEDGRLLCK